MTTLAHKLWRAKRYDEARAHSEEIAGTYQRLALSQPEVFSSGFGRHLGVLGKTYRSMSLDDKALIIEEVAVNYFRELSIDRPDLASPELVSSLLILCASYARDGRKEEAIALGEECQETRLHSERRDPSLWKIKKASSLINLAWLVKANEPAEALLHAQEAVDLCRSVVEASGPGFETNLARALVCLASICEKLEDISGCLANYEEAVKFYRMADSVATSLIKSELATAAFHLSRNLSNENLYSEALPYAIDAAHLFQDLAELGLDKHQHMLISANKKVEFLNDALSNSSNTD
jgi:tetratricopeptide (TPR) repeat protein